MNGSSRFNINSKDIKKIAKGAVVAMVGGLIVFLSDIGTSIDWGVYAPLVGAVASIAVNFLRKWVSDNSNDSCPPLTKLDYRQKV